jgi:hypothetical protein
MSRTLHHKFTKDPAKPYLFLIDGANCPDSVYLPFPPHTRAYILDSPPRPPTFTPTKNMTFHKYPKSDRPAKQIAEAELILLAAELAKRDITTVIVSNTVQAQRLFEIMGFEGYKVKLKSDITEKKK